MEPQDQSQTASLAQPGTKTAPQAMQPEARGEHHGPRGEHGFGPPSPDKFIERFDTNKDGKLQAAELPERMQQNIGEIDTSGDGVVTKDELVARFAAKRAEFEQKAKARFDQKDTNHDGALDQSEVGAEHWAKLSVADANGDQKVTPDELKAAFEAGKLKPMMFRGEHGRRWEHGGNEQAPAAPAAPAAPL
ncbi:MAG TPA: hypothetical protein VNG33_23225 [Polyangiaceae bacterium]|nr:hypothetical protein [Polyangiaceae bacterium]